MLSPNAECNVILYNLKTEPPTSSQVMLAREEDSEVAVIFNTFDGTKNNKKPINC